MEKIVFVCLGNICRSPMAEFVMKDLVEKEGKNFEVESRATSSWEHGNPIHPGTRALLTAYGIPFDATKGSQQISQEDFQYFDQIIAMDESNKENLEKMAPADQKHKIKMLETNVFLIIGFSNQGYLYEEENSNCTNKL